MALDCLLGGEDSGYLELAQGIWRAVGQQLSSLCFSLGVSQSSGLSQSSWAPWLHHSTDGLGQLASTHATGDCPRQGTGLSYFRCLPCSQHGAGPLAGVSKTTDIEDVT